MASAAQQQQRDLEGQPRHCLACGTEIVGPYCHVCGQKDDDCRRSIAHLAGETVANVAALDGKFVRTVHSSVLRPGKHLHQYAHGRRSPFTPPVRFFFVVTFAFFATLWLTDRNIFVLQLVPEDPDDVEVAEGNLNFNVMIEGEDAEISDLPEGAVKLAPDEPSEVTKILDEVRGDVVAALEEEGVDVPQSLRGEEQPEPEVPVADDPPAEEEAPGEEESPGVLSEFIRGVGDGYAEAAAADAAANAPEEGDTAEDLADGAEDDGPKEPDSKIVPYGGFFLKAQDVNYTEEEKEWLRSRVQMDGTVSFMGRELSSERIADALIMTMQNPNAFNNALNEAIPALMLLFVPLMALLGAMFIRGPDALIYDHLLLSIQTHAFAYVILTLIVWTGFFVPSEIAFIAFAAGMPIYYLLGLKGAFGRGWFHSGFTTLFVGFVYHLLFVVALSGAVVFSILEIV